MVKIKQVYMQCFFLVKHFKLIIKIKQYYFKNDLNIFKHNLLNLPNSIIPLRRFEANDHYCSSTRSVDATGWRPNRSGRKVRDCDNRTRAVSLQLAANTTESNETKRTYIQNGVHSEKT